MACLFFGLLVGAIVMVFVIDPIAPGTETTSTGERRIVSFSPALTRTLQLLELDGDLVGCTRYCPVEPDSTPLVGDLLEIDREQVLRLAPTHILIQPPAAGIDRGLVDLSQEYGWSVGAFPSLDTLDAVESMVRELPALLEPDGPARDALTARAEGILRSMRGAIDAPQIATGRVLLLHAVEPISAFGQSTYLHEILERTGATNVVSAAGWATLSREDLVRLDPDAIVLIRGSDGGEIDLSAALDGLGLRAVDAGSIAVLRHDDAFLPSPALGEVSRALRAELRRLAPVRR